MTSHRQSWVQLSLAAVLFGGIGIAGVGCESEEPPPPPQTRRTVTPPPAPPPVKTIQDLMEEYRIDERVILRADRAPESTEERVAILEFFDAFARGDAEALGSMLTPLDRMELEAMVAAGVWDESTAGISSIEIQTGENSLGQSCALAVIEVGFEFEPQLWYYTVEGDTPVFEAAPAPPGILDELSGDWIAAWHRILEEEMALAMVPDEDLNPVQTNLDEDEDGASSSGGTSRGTGSSPNSSPPPGRGRRKPPSTPRRPPGPR
ncbi:MAG: hypothetical protein JSV91_04135 [Phycisphaerales bacterium]|nr:MAG: hypothetical protein JSV91_04135 [Phycisphaerales bacterium]